MEAYKLGEQRQIKGTVVAPIVCRWTKKNYDKFELEVDPGKFHSPEIVGVLGKNAIGKFSNLSK